ncbi:MAG: LytTR family transcriptional regulator DNA-binding domain-containing protein [Lachnospiraceae bacterium]|jgi:ABC-2 type transport system ATP-binding protein|nr:LytTR family transcriptional regulator DNA-binding domain-containing protein [Lachnospiraceae bacterium]
MEKHEYATIQELLRCLTEHGCIHIEGNQEVAEEALRIFRDEYGLQDTSYLLRTDRGYERESVYAYLKLFRALFRYRGSLEQVMERFGLTALKHKRIRLLSAAEALRLQYARISMQDASVCFLDEPLLNLDSEAMKSVVQWLESQYERGVHFVSVNASLKHALLLPGNAFYLDNGSYIEIEREEDEPAEEEQEISVWKIPVKSGNQTLLFEPKDIDYIESLNRCNYLSIRGTMFQVQLTMDELEKTLKKSGFFRCHRSYIVNIQRVERFEKWTKNSYVLLLNTPEHTQIPLAKGRIDEMKDTFHW